MDNEQSFYLGQSFSSYTELIEKIHLFKENEFVELSITDSRKLEKAKKSGRISKGRLVNEDLVYYELKYACIHGGPEFHSKTTGKRKSS